MKRRTSFKVLSLIAASLLATAPVAHADDAFPNGPVKLIVPYSPGGGNDVLGRALGQQLSILWKQPVIIENRPGASGTVGSRYVVTSKPDGYTLLIVPMSHATNPLINAPLPYDTDKDFTPITKLAASSNVLVVKANSPYKSVADILAAARAKPGALSYGNSGTATSMHLAGELLKYSEKVDIVAVPFKGGSPALNDLLGGHVTMTINGTPEAMPFIKSGSLRALAVTSATRDPFLPDVPTMQEAGVSGYENSAWYGIFGPAGMPRDLVNRIQANIATVLKTQPMQDLSKTLGVQLIGSSPDELRQHLSDEQRRWAPVVKAARLKTE